MDDTDKKQDQNDQIVDQENQDTAIFETLKKQSEDYLNGWQTERANFLNYQRDENERISKILTLNERNIILEILTIVDNFDLLIKNLNQEDEYLKGVKLVYEQFISFLNRHKCVSYDSLNQLFDPNIHEAIEIIQDETKENNLIIEEIQKGYKLNDVVLRPAKVKVIINTK
jgi:molecular chaperone GrpE